MGRASGRSNRVGEPHRSEAGDRQRYLFLTTHELSSVGSGPWLRPNMDRRLDSRQKSLSNSERCDKHGKGRNNTLSSTPIVETSDGAGGVGRGAGSRAPPLPHVRIKLPPAALVALLAIMLGREPSMDDSPCNMGVGGKESTQRVLSGRCPFPGVSLTGV